MEKPREDTPAADYLPRSAFTVSAVAADGEVIGRETGLAKVHDDLKKSLRALEDSARRSRTRRLSS